MRHTNEWDIYNQCDIYNQGDIYNQSYTDHPMRLISARDNNKNTYSQINKRDGLKIG